MTDLLSLFETRRSVAPHLMREPGPTPDERDRLLRIASRIPDHGKLVPWRFIVFEGEAREKAGVLLAERYKALHPDATDDMIAVEAKRLARAPLVIAVVSRSAPHVKIPQWEQELSAGAACTALTFAVSAMGYVTAWLTEWFAYDRDVVKAFGLAEEERIAGFIHIGRPGDPPQDRPRPPLDEIVTYFGR